MGRTMHVRCLNTTRNEDFQFVLVMVGVGRWNDSSRCAFLCLAIADVSCDVENVATMGVVKDLAVIRQGEEGKTKGRFGEELRVQDPEHALSACHRHHRSSGPILTSSIPHPPPSTHIHHLKRSSTLSGRTTRFSTLHPVTNDAEADLRSARGRQTEGC